MFTALLIATIFSCGLPIPLAIGFPLSIPRIVFAVILVIVVFQVRADGLRYPWTHWLGMGTELWYGVFNIALFFSGIFQGSHP